MSTQPHGASRPLPERANLRHLKDQAKDLLMAGDAASIADAQFKIARLYGFSSWPKLKEYVESLEEIGQLKEAIDTNDLESVKALMIRNPKLHETPVASRGRKPLTWVAECRLPREEPGAARLAMAKWMIENGSDVHQDQEAPLARAALADNRIAMMEFLVSRGADVNARINENCPIVFFPCNTLAAGALKWLLEHGADPNVGGSKRRNRGTALDYVIGTYHRSPLLGECIDLLLNADGKTRYSTPGLLDLLRNRIDRLEEHLGADPSLIHRQFAEFDFGGGTGTRRLTVRGGTLLHVAAEYGNVDAARLLLDKGADVNARATIDRKRVGGQTAIFHAVTQFDDWGLSVARLLIERGADLSVRVKLPGHYERLDDVVECTPLGYAMRFPEGSIASKTVRLLKDRGAVE